MAKIFQYTMILIGIIATLTAIGAPTFTSALMQNLANFKFTNLFTADFWTQLFGGTGISGLIAGTTVVAAIIVGYLARNSPESFIIAPFATLVAGWSIADFASIASLVNTYASGDYAWLLTIINTVFAVLIGGYFIAMVQWWRGNDI